jgi:hypothetical protein
MPCPGVVHERVPRRATLSALFAPRGHHTRRPDGTLLVLGSLAYWSLGTTREVLVHPIESLRLYRLLRSFESAAERKDVDAMVALVHSDADHRGLTTGRLVQGRPALRQLFAAELAGEARTEQMEVDLVSFRFVTPEVAVGDLTIVYRDYRLGKPVWPVFREHTFVVLSKREGEWGIASTSAGGHHRDGVPR